MKTFKHLLAKTVSLVLCVSLLAGATVIPVFAAKPRAINHNTVLTVEKIAEDIVTYLENAKMPELLPKDSAITYNILILTPITEYHEHQNLNCNRATHTPTLF